MKFDFPNQQGEILSGRLDLPQGAVKAYALFAHCFTCSKDGFAAKVISEGLVANGIGVLRFDFTGLGLSEGEFSNSNFSSNVEDLLSACGELTKKYRHPELLIGHSLGGAAVLMAAVKLSQVRAVVTIAAPSSAEHVAHLFSDRIESIENEGVSEVLLAGRKFTIKKQFLDDIKRASYLDEFALSHKALLVMHSPADTLVSMDHASSIFLTAKHPKSFISLNESDHLLSKKVDALYVANVIAAWSQGYVSPAQEKVIDVQQDAVIVQSRDNEKFVQDVFSGLHHLVADEPKAVGGTGLGMDPYDLLLASLGACTSMTIKMYAEKKGIALAQVKVHLKHKKIHAQDCQSCGTKEGKIDRIEKVIELQGHLTPEEKNKLLEIAERCPVNLTLQSEISIIH